jgi:hypothetical protein
MNVIKIIGRKTVARVRPEKLILVLSGKQV